MVYHRKVYSVSINHIELRACSRCVNNKSQIKIKHYYFIFLFPLLWVLTSKICVFFACKIQNQTNYVGKVLLYIKKCVQSILLINFKIFNTNYTQANMGKLLVSQYLRAEIDLYFALLGD